MEAATGTRPPAAAAAAKENSSKWSWMCTVIEADTTNFSYRVCSICETTLPSHPSATCSLCIRSTTSYSPASKRLYRLLLSVATADSVTPVVLFDRSARVLMGCSSDDLFDLCRAHPSAPATLREALRGEMCRMEMSAPRSGTAQHLRAVNVVPLRTGFRPLVHALRRIYHGNA